MNLLLLILTVMTWTVKDKNTVTGDGVWPNSMVVSYSNTYNKGQVRDGDTATLSLMQTGGIDIQEIKVYVRSNKNSGAGTFTVQANGQTVATKTGAFNEWVGAYDNENYHPISLLTSALTGVNDLVITLIGTQNSLHIEKYEITYGAAAPFTVTLRKGNTVYSRLTETTRGAGVVLPILPDTAEWRFIGWSETEIWETHDYPALRSGNTTFVPSEDCTLWATYSFYEQEHAPYMTEVASSVYLYVNTENGTALCGVPQGGRMGFANVNIEDMNQYYWVTFVTPDTAYIYHAITDTPIGYSGTNMAAVSSPWSVYHEGDETLFYMTYNGKTYVLWLNCFNGSEYYAGLLNANIGPSPMKLQQNPIEDHDPLITCHPENPQEVENVESGALNVERTLMQFGNYELRLVNGKKQLRIRN